MIAKVSMSATTVNAIVTASILTPMSNSNFRARPSGPRGESATMRDRGNDARGAGDRQRPHDVEDSELAPCHPDRRQPLELHRLPPQLTQRRETDEHETRRDGDPGEDHQRVPLEVDHAPERRSETSPTVVVNVDHPSGPLLISATNALTSEGPPRSRTSTPEP
jgi:hypothetical protein